MGVARRMLLLISLTVKTLKNPSMLAALSFYRACSSACHPAPSADAFLAQLARGHKEDDETDDGPALASRGISRSNCRPIWAPSFKPKTGWQR